MDSNKLRKYLKSKIEKATAWTASFTTAIDVKDIPYITFDYVELMSDEYGKHILELTVDAWDKNTPRNVITVIDALDEAFKKHKELTDDFMIQIFLGSNRQFVEDEEKAIKRLQRKYDLVVYERGA